VVVHFCKIVHVFSSASLSMITVWPCYLASLSVVGLKLLHKRVFQLVAMGLRDHKLDSVSMATNIWSMFEYSRAGRVYKSVCNDVKQQTQLHTNYRIGLAC